MAESEYDSNYKTWLQSAGITPEKDPVSIKSVVKQLAAAYGGLSGTYAPITTTVVQPSGDATGATDTAALNTALSAARIAGGGIVQGVPGKVYYINAPLVVGSNTTLNMTGCTIIEVAGSNCNMVQSHAYANPVTATDGAINAGSATLTSSVAYATGNTVTVAGAGNGGNNPLTSNIDSTSSGTSIVLDKLGTGAPNPAQLIVLSQALSTSGAITSLPVSALPAAIGAGTITITSGNNTQTFTASAASAAATSITITSATPNFAYPVNSVISLGTATCGITGATVKVWQRDSNVKVIGGFWQMGTNTASGASFLNRYPIMMYFVDGLTVDIEGGSSVQGGSFIQCGGCTYAILQAKNLNCGSGGIEVDGPSFEIQVPFVTGYTYDDSLAFLCANGYSGSAYPTTGDITNVTVGTVQTSVGTNTHAAGIIKTIAGCGNTADNIKVSGGIFGSCYGNPAWVGDDPSGQLQMIGGYYGSIDYGTVGAMPNLGNVANYSQLILYNVNGKRVSAKLNYPERFSFANLTPAVQIKATSSTVSSILESLELSGDIDLSGSASTVQQIGLYVNNVNQTIGKLTFLNTNFTANTNGTSSLVTFNTASAINEIDCVNLQGNGQSVNAELIRLATSGCTVTRINFTGGSVTGIGTLVDDFTTTANTVAMSGGFAFTSGGTAFRVRSTGTKTYIYAGCRLDTITTVVYATGASTIIVSGNPVFSAITTWLTNTGGGTVRFADCVTIPVNVASLTGTTGDTANNTTAASGPVGPVQYNGTVWVALAPVTTTVSTPTFANGTAAQLAQLVQDAMVYLTVGTAGTAFSIAIGPTSTPANTIVSSATATSGSMYTVRLPAGWYLKWTATTATIATQTAILC